MSEVGRKRKIMNREGTKRILAHWRLDEAGIAALRVVFTEGSARQTLHLR